MKPNKLRELLRSGKPTLSTRIQSSWPSTVEVIGHTGLFDYVEFLAEYAPYTLADLENFCRAAELHDLGTMIKLTLSRASTWPNARLERVSKACCLPTAGMPMMRASACAL